MAGQIITGLIDGASNWWYKPKEIAAKIDNGRQKAAVFVAQQVQRMADEHTFAGATTALVCRAGLIGINLAVAGAQRGGHMVISTVDDARQGVRGWNRLCKVAFAGALMMGVSYAWRGQCHDSDRSTQGCGKTDFLAAACLIPVSLVFTAVLSHAYSDYKSGRNVTNLQSVARSIPRAKMASKFSKYATI